MGFYLRVECTDEMLYGATEGSTMKELDAKSRKDGTTERPQRHTHVSSVSHFGGRVIHGWRVQH